MLEKISIVMVEPQHPGNIGSVARAMKTMDLKNLVLVAPSRYPDPQALWRSANAADILEKAVVLETLEEALNDVHFVVGTSARVRQLSPKILEPRSLGPKLAALNPGSSTAILFGREDSGLTNEELQKCHVQLQIPASEEYGVLNLAMAVQIVAYELFVFFTTPSVISSSPTPANLKASSSASSFKTVKTSSFIIIPTNLLFLSTTAAEFKL